MNRQENDPRWYVIHTKPKQEYRASGNLLAWGVETLNPKLKSRRPSNFSGLLVEQVNPLFPRYIFARFDAATMLHKVWFTRGVNNVVSFGGNPLPVSDEIISVLQSKLDADGLVRLSEDDLAQGDRVKITGGHLRDFEGVFERKVKASDRVVILLTAVNFQGCVEVESHSVERMCMAAAAGAGRV
jgi:transcriptional antiterminator RfaH